MFNNWSKDLDKQQVDHATFNLNHSRQQIADMNKREAEQATANEIIALKNKIKEYESLLARPMKDIAAANEDFKKTYELQQQMIAEWIMAQKAWQETAMQLGMKLGMTPEEVKEGAAPNTNAVLENRTQHGNDASESLLLQKYAADILAMRKSKGKA